MAAADASPGCAEALSSLGGLPAVVLRLVLLMILVRRHCGMKQRNTAPTTPSRTMLYSLTTANGQRQKGIVTYWLLLPPSSGGRKERVHACSKTHGKRRFRTQRLNNAARASLRFQEPGLCEGWGMGWGKPWSRTNDSLSHSRLASNRADFANEVKTNATWHHRGRHGDEFST